MSGHVYVLKRLDLPHYKIGHSYRLEERITEQKRHYGWEWDFLFAVEYENAFEEELKLHRAFKDKRIKGEWFALNERDLEYIRELNGGKIYTGSFKFESRFLDMDAELARSFEASLKKRFEEIGLSRVVLSIAIKLAEMDDFKRTYFHEQLLEFMDRTNKRYEKALKKVKSGNLT